MKRIGLLLFMLATSCGPKLADYSAESPKLDPKQFFDGTLDAWGQAENWRGVVTSRFHMTMTASWQGEAGHFHEEFDFADGTHRTRDWTIRATETGFVGTAPDVIGEAAGEVSGNALHWVYTIELPRDGVRRVTFDDWLHLVTPDTMFSQVAISKFGLPVGRMTMFFRRRP